MDDNRFDLNKKNNESFKEIVVVTSLAPKNLEIQKRAIGSWIELGFRVFSINVIEEIKDIVKFFPNIEFISVTRSAKIKYGKPYIYFDDVLEFFKNQGSRICGIINSDIIIRDPNFKTIISTEALNSFVYGSRVEADSLENLKGVMLESGFDYYFFDREVIDCYPPEDFCFGQPLIDWWIVLNPATKGIPVKKLMDLSVYHVRHPQKWDQETSSELSIKMLQYFPYPNSYNSSTMLSKYAIYMYDLINRNTKYIFPYKIEENGPSILIVYDNKDNNSKDSKTYQSIINQTYKKINIKLGNIEDIDFSNVHEDFIYAIEEGYYLNKHFIQTALSLIDNKDYAVCGLKRTYNDGTTLFQSLYMIHNLDGPLKHNYLSKSHSRVCTIYRTNCFVQNGTFDDGLLKDKKIKLIGIALVETTLNTFIRRELGAEEQKNIFIYGAGGHTQLLLENVNFANLNICGILDRNKSLEGQVIFGYPVFNLEQIDRFEFDYILISSQTYEKEIFESLKARINHQKIVRVYYDSLFYKV